MCNISIKITESRSSTCFDVPHQKLGEALDNFWSFDDGLIQVYDNVHRAVLLESALILETISGAFVVHEDDILSTLSQLDIYSDNI